MQEGIRLMEAAAADLFQDAPGTSASTGTTTDLSSSHTYSESGGQEPDEGDGDFAEVSEWTHEQVSGQKNRTGQTARHPGDDNPRISLCRGMRHVAGFCLVGVRCLHEHFLGCG